MVAFDAGNLEPVISSLKKSYPNARITIAADHDQWTKTNKGLEEAHKTSKKHHCSVVYPTFRSEHDALKPTDFNDLHCLEGVAELSKQLTVYSKGFKMPSDEQEKAFVLEDPYVLRRPLPDSTAFPIDALGSLLGKAALGIEDMIQSPLAMCAQSVLSTTCLAVQGHINIKLPIGTGQIRPVSLYFVTIGLSGERKDSSDNEALKPVRQKEKELRAEYDFHYKAYEDLKSTWDGAKQAILKNKQTSQEQKLGDLEALGPEPEPPIEPVLIVEEPTIEGVHKYYQKGSPILGLMSSEGGQFISGHGMNAENKIKTATALSSQWDGKPIKRMRSSDGTIVLFEKKLTIHLMFQPGIYELLLADADLNNQGLTSRLLCSYPDSKIGTRFSKESSLESFGHIHAFQDTLYALLNKGLPLEMGGKKNDLEPRVLEMSAETKRAFFQFSDETEKEMAPKGRFETITGLASKLPEHACRLGAIMAFVENPTVGSLDVSYFERGKTIALYYATEALRLLGNARSSPELLMAERFLNWLKTSWKEEVICLPAMYQRGPSFLRDVKSAKSVAQILSAHGWLIKLKGGMMIEGKHRREVWKIRKDAFTADGQKENLVPVGPNDSNNGFHKDHFTQDDPKTLATLANFSKTESPPKTDRQPLGNQGIPGDTGTSPLENSKTLATLATLAGGHCENLFCENLETIPPSVSAVNPEKTDTPVLLPKLPGHDPFEVEYQLITNREEAQESLKKIASQDETVGLDLETTGLFPHDGAKARLLQVSPKEGPVLVVDLFAVGGLAALKDSLQNLKAVAHNAVFEMKFLKSEGISLTLDCTLIANHALTGDMAKLSDLCAKHLNIPVDKTLQTSDWGVELTKDQLSYAAADALYTRLLFENLMPLVQKQGVDRVYTVCKGAQQAVVDMEMTGMPFDRQAHQCLFEQLTKERDDYQTKLLEHLPDINLNSGKQLGEWLTQTLGGETSKAFTKWPKTPSGKLTTSTKGFKKGLSLLPKPLQALITSCYLPYKEKEKHITTFGESLLKTISPRTGRIHGNFKMTGTKTGRFSCSNPNLQNIPRGKAFRGLFKAPEGRIFVIADYSQMELRVAAMVAKEEKLLEAYKEGKDIHAITAAMLLTKTPEEVTKQERQLAKAVNFGLLYGQGVKGLKDYAADTYGVDISEAEAKTYKDAWFEAFPAFADWQRRSAITSKMTSTVTTPLGRTRRFLGSKDGDQYCATKVFNTPIQGGAAEVMLAALGRLSDLLVDLDAKPIAVIHDEVIVETSPAEASKVEEALQEAMLKGMLDIFPEATTKGLVDAHRASSWADK